MPLTDMWLKANQGKPRDSVQEKSDRDGMGVRVSKTGKVTFQLRYRFQGKPARMDLGTYPGMTLKEAREETLLRRRQLEQGSDPRALKKAEQGDASSELSNEELIRLWFDGYCKKRKKGWEEILRSFEIHVFPKIGDLPAKRTTAMQWVKMLEELAASRPSVAYRVLGNLKQAHRWAIRRDMIDSLPLEAITAKHDLDVSQKTGGRALSDTEIKQVYTGVIGSRMAARSKLYVMLILFFGCRPGELREARKDEFDLEKGIWVIPAHRHKTGAKTGRPLVRPLIDEVKPMIEKAMALSLQHDFLFSGEHKGVKLLSHSATLGFPNSIMQVVKRIEGKEMEHFSLYDLRKTARTNWASIAEPHVCEVMLGHKLPGVWQVYDHYDYYKEQKAAYQKWWARLSELIGVPPIP
ncbi:site-specific integrase [Cobetia sp. 1AS1]|uniref:tyrosine-type recombinase/integrase n=1 Tax=Cobetia sp. 1AS1 TaxID=3040016 RepID=UPI00244BEF3C|nr:site-specific integrase [Cobetia sp. 1AS1]MDH2296076.1 integrase arm-type DNA-binding domain-containing protein [Cobetia sp. 1AS1]